MKTTMKQLATVTFLAFLLLSGNANAHGTAVKHVCFEESESTLQVESWMTNESIWEVNSAVITEFTEEAEAGSAIEDWMTDYNIWNVKTTENEPELSIEPCMISHKIWK